MLGNSVKSLFLCDKAHDGTVVRRGLEYGSPGRDQNISRIFLDLSKKVLYQDRTRGIN
jgi:hypothetical protein